MPAPFIAITIRRRITTIIPTTRITARITADRSCRAVGSVDAPPGQRIGTGIDQIDFDQIADIRFIGAMNRLQPG